MPPVTTLVQACHAGMEATRYYPPPEGVVPNLVVIGVSDEQRLQKWADKLTNAGVKFCLFNEPDRNNEATALGTECITGDARSIFKHCQLLKMSPNEEVSNVR